MQVDELALGVRVCVLNLMDSGGGFGLGAGGDVYFGVFLVEDGGEVFAQAAGAAGDDEDLGG